jgi:hypothetical protein
LTILQIKDKESIGISSGGVAEIFHTNSEDEVILMKERKVGVSAMASGKNAS